VQEMYGSENTDLIVKYYDLAFGISGEAEIDWYLDKVKRFGGPVLDLACGTGRLALLLAQQGFEITAIDSSQGMLNLFRDKLRALPPEIGRRISIHNQSMSDFDLGTRFNTVICCDAFFHNLNIEEQKRCLRCVASHLTPHGRFVFNLPNPTWDFILKSSQSGGREFEERGRYKLERGQGTLLVEQAQAGNTLEQTITTTIRITRFDAHGIEIESGQSQWTSRYLFYYEAIELLQRCGFEVESLVGDYQNGPLTERGQLIFQVRLGKMIDPG
jgi:SAM-dependent methyltransferase